MSFPPIRDMSFPLVGGLDLVNTMQDKHPGSIISGTNIQIIAGQAGYSRWEGIERCTNDTLASNAAPVYLLVASNTATLAVGDVGTSGGLTVVCLAAVSGTGEQVVPVVCDDQTEDFSAVSSIVFTGGTITVDSVVEPSEYLTETEIGTIRSQANDSYLTFIPVVTGSGSNDGGFRLGGVNYVFRNGTLYKGGELSWISVAMPDVMYFESGVSEIEVADVITDGVETATVASVTRQTGAWNSTLDEEDQSAGYFTLTGASGAFTVGNDLTINGATVPAFFNGNFTSDTIWTKGAGCTISGNSATIAAHTSADTLSQFYVLSEGDVVELTIVLSGVTAGTITPTIGDNIGVPDSGDILSTNGTHVVTIAATRDVTIFKFAYDADFLGSVESIVAAVGRMATVTTVNDTYVLPTGGTYETEIYNFTNVAGADSIYGCSGVGEAFEFDGTNYIPIHHPDSTTYPKHLMIHQERLHLCFPGGEKPWSVSGEPRVFNPLLGAGTHSTGSEITGCETISGSAAFVGCTDSRWMLLGYGLYDDESSTRNWSFTRYIREAGCNEWTMTGGDRVLFSSGGKIYMLYSTDTSAQYAFKDISEMFMPALVAKLDDGAFCSVWIAEKTQYRIFFADGNGYCVSFRGDTVIGATPFVIPVDVKSVFKAIEDDKEVVLFVSSETDYLYRMDSGNSFDGDAITGSFRIPFHGYGSSRHEKEFPQFVLELAAPLLVSGQTTFQYAATFDYGTYLAPTPVSHTVEDVESPGAFYGENPGYSEFVWSGPIVSEIFAYVDGHGANMSLLIAFSTKNDLIFSFKMIHMDYVILGRKGRG